MNTQKYTRRTSVADKKYTASEWAQIEGGHTVEPVKEGLTFMQSLGEARMFKTREQISHAGARSVTDHLFVSLLSLYAMSQDYNYAPVAKEYARRTNQLGSYNNPSPSGTDLYQTIFSVKRPDLMPGEKSEMLMNKVNINDAKVKGFLNKIKMGTITPADASTFLLKMERDLKIQDPKLRAARRLTQDWHKLSTAQRQLVGTQIMKYFRLNARRSDMMPLFVNFAKDNGLNIDDKKKRSIGKSILRKAAAFGAGYAIGKSVEL